MKCHVCEWRPKLKLKLLSYGLIYRLYLKYWKIALDPVPSVVIDVNDIYRTVGRCPRILESVCGNYELEIHFIVVYCGYRSETQKYKVVSLELHVNIPQSGEGGVAGSNSSSSSSPIGSCQGLHCNATTFGV
jgi:hypothetical protein